MVGEHIGPYKILSSLGAGGMGEVYRAHDGKLGRDVAVKVLPRDLAADSDRRVRMVREARAAAALNHPNICTVHDVGEADGHIYIAMEVIEGQSLSTRLSAGALPLDEVLRIGHDVADAVAHAHARGIVHRDLKSANIMITPEGRVKVLDFGLAKRVRGDEVADVSTRATAPHTGAHTVLGTLPYMSPEQLRGQPVDARSDIWALGVILYEMASGTRPFGGTTSFETGSAILHQEPPPLPGRVPPPLNAVVDRCLQKEPARRYQLATELRAALEMIRSVPLTEHLHDVPAGRRRWVIATAVAAVAMSAVFAAIWSQRDRNGPDPVPAPPGGTSPAILSIAVLPLENLSGDASQDYFVAGIQEALTSDLARIGLKKVIAKSSADAYKGTKKTPTEVGRELGVDGLVTGSVVRAGDRVHVTANLVAATTGAIVWTNRYERDARNVLSLQNDVVAAIAREVRANVTADQKARLATSRPVNPDAHDAYLKGRSAFSSMTSTGNPKYLDTAIEHLERAIEVDPTYAPAHAALAEMHLTLSQGSWRAPHATFPRARSAALRAVDLDESLAAGHAALANVFMWFDWNWAGALREIQRALELSPDTVEPQVAALTYWTLVAAHADEAARISQRIVELDPLNPFSPVQPVWVASFSRRYDEVITKANMLVELQPNNLMGPMFLATAHAAKGMRAEVVSDCRRAMEILGGAPVMQFIAGCAGALGLVGEVSEARRYLERLERAPAGVWIDPQPMGEAYAGLGDAVRAAEWYQRGLEQRSPNMIYMKTSTFVDRVRSDPRIQAIIRQMNFP